MKIRLSFGEGAFALPLDIMKYTDKTDALGLRLVLLLCSEQGKNDDVSVKDIAKHFAVSEKEIEDALSFWERAGILAVEDSGSKKSKAVSRKAATTSRNEITVVQNEGSLTYTGEEIARIVGERADISAMLTECSRIAEKLFSNSETNKMIGLVDYLRLEPEYIIMLFSYCRSMDRGSVHYVEKMAYELYNEGIVTYTALESYLAEKERHHCFEGKVRGLIGVGQRALTAKEKKFISLWCDMNIPYDMLVLAYEVTVNNTQSASMPYMNKVLSNWREAGYKTRADVEAATDEYKRKKEASVSGSFNTDEFFEAAIERSYRAADNGKK